METREEKLAGARRRLLTVHEYHRMGEVGILHEDDRVELIEGELIQMAAIGTRHFSCVNALTRLLVLGVGDEAVVSVQNPVRLSEIGEPQPDLTLLRLRDYRESLPGPDDVLLLIEVSDTTLRYDREFKLPLYARAAIREVWIVDLPSETVEVHTEPSDGGYGLVRRVRRGDALRPEALPALAVPVDTVLG